MPIYDKEIITRKEAKALGLKYSFSGKPCNFGNIAPRLVINSCCQCEQHKQKIKNAHYSDSRQKYLKTYYSSKEYKEKNNKRTKEQYHTEAGRLKNKKYHNSEKGKLVLSKAKRNYRNSENGRAKTYTGNAIRRSKILQATPIWYESELVENVYKECIELSKITGITYHVDHIVPLKSDIVCGLHCIANLRIIEGKKNCSKGNRYWDNMP